MHNIYCSLKVKCVAICSLFIRFSRFPYVFFESELILIFWAKNCLQLLYCLLKYLKHVQTICQYRDRLIVFKELLTHLFHKFLTLIRTLQPYVAKETSTLLWPEKWFILIDREGNLIGKSKVCTPNSRTGSYCEGNVLNFYHGRQITLNL